MRRRDLVPIELRERDQWIVWRHESHNGRLQKVPYQPSQPSRRASSTMSETWDCFAAAVEASVNFDGVGYVFSAEDPNAGVDLDRCILDERLHPAAAAIVAQLDSYTEISPSKVGVKVILRASVPGGRGRSTKHTAWGDELAVYDRARFFAITGRAISPDQTIRDRQRELDALIATVFPTFTAPRPRGSAPLDASDEEVLARAFAARNGSKVRALYHGDISAYGGDRSRADLALVALLVFWTSDLDQIERLLRRSGLVRGKWDRPWGDTTWIRRVIQKAGA
jgi:putative DNA primase/helicase